MAGAAAGPRRGRPAMSKLERKAALEARRPNAGTPGNPSKVATPCKWQDVPEGRQAVSDTTRETLEAHGFAFDDRGFGLDTLGLGRFPNEVLDVLLSRTELNIRDHLALSGANKMLRSLYTDEVWEAVIAHRPMPIRGQLQPVDCHPDCDCEQTLRTMATGMPEKAEAIVMINSEGVIQTPKDQAVAIVHDVERTLSQSQAKRIYAVSPVQLRTLTVRKTVTDSKTAKITTYYLESAVEALALRWHGGLGGHYEHVQRLHDRRANDSNKAPAHRRKTRVPRAYGQKTGKPGAAVRAAPIVGAA